MGIDASKKEILLQIPVKTTEDVHAALKTIVYKGSKIIVRFNGILTVWKNHS